MQVVMPHILSTFVYFICNLTATKAQKPKLMHLQLC
jgi:hypothetical protein